MNIDDLKGCFANITDDELLRDNGNLYAENKELKQEIERLNKENKILRENAEHNDKVVDKVNWENKRLNNIINELEKWLEESIEKHTEDYLDWKYDRNVYLAGSEKLQNVFDKLQELKGSDK